MPKQEKKTKVRDASRRNSALASGPRGAPRRATGGLTRSLPSWVPWAAAAVVAIAALVGIIVALSPRSEMASAEEPVPLEGADHFPEGTPLVYRSYPPASGPHYPRTAPYGVHTQEMPEGYWVHNLEHGGVVVLYNCPDGCPDLVEKLREIYSSAPPSARWRQVKMVVAPYSRMDNRITLLAWGWRERLDEFDRERILRFYRAHLDRGPEDAP